MRKGLFIGLVFLGFSCQPSREPAPQPPVLPLRGADLSFTPEIRQAGTPFYDREGRLQEPVEMLRQAGCNLVRLRLWHTPAGGHSSLQEVAAFAEELRGAGLQVLLDLHYSDTWADPGRQVKPAAWQDLDMANLTDSVYAYTYRVLRAVQPDYVQIGNELNNGFLWPEGHINGSQGFVTLLKAAIAAARQYNPGLPVVIHYAGYAGSQGFYARLAGEGVEYDIIALSYYPWWHGKDLTQLAATLEKLGREEGKALLLAEVAYPFTLDWADQTTNIVGLDNQLLSGYPATPAGQAAYLERLRSLLAGIPGALGFCYWAPDWVAFKGAEATDGSPWENLALFDFDHRALKALEVFRER